MLTLYLSSRDLVVTEDRIDRVQGVLLVDPEYVRQEKKVYGQVTLTFRYGREDEEVMGLKFCNEAVMCLAQLYPPPDRTAIPVQTEQGQTIPPPPRYETTPLQDALVKRLGENAFPFTMELTPLAPPSVQLVPAKEYNGAPIGTSYDIRAYVADRADDKLHKKTTVRMGVRVVQRASAPPPPPPSAGPLGSRHSLHQAGRRQQTPQPPTDVASPINGSLAGSEHSTPARTNNQQQQQSIAQQGVDSDNEVFYTLYLNV